MNELLGAYLLGACADDEADAMRDHIADLRGLRERGRRARARARRAAQRHTHTCRAAAAQGARDGAGAGRCGAVRRCWGAARGRSARPGHRRAPRGRESRLRSWLRSPIPLATAAACALVLIAGGVLIGSRSAATRAAAGRAPCSARSTARRRAARRSSSIDDSGTARLVVSGLPDPGAAARLPGLAAVGRGQAGADEGAVLGDGGRQRRGRGAGDLEGVDQVMVTSEPDGGSKAPTRAPVIAVTV